MDAVAPLPSKKTGVQKKIPSPLKLQLSPETPRPHQPERSLSKISSYDDLALKLEKCSIQTPLMEGYGCKDVRKSRTFEPFRRRYFVLYNEVLIYYQHKAQFEKDKKKGLVSCLLFGHCWSVKWINAAWIGSISWFKHQACIASTNKYIFELVMNLNMKGGWTEHLEPPCVWAWADQE